MKTRKLRIKRKVVVKSRKKGKLNRKISYRRKQRKSMIRRRTQQNKYRRHNLKKRFSRKMRGGGLFDSFIKGPKQIPMDKFKEATDVRNAEIASANKDAEVATTLQNAKHMLVLYNSFKNSPLANYSTREHHLYEELEQAVNENATEKINRIMTDIPNAAKAKADAEAEAEAAGEAR